MAQVGVSLCVSARLPAWFMNFARPERINCTLQY